MKTKKYVVTDLVDTHFQGKRVRDRKAPIELTAAQAEHDLRVGNIKLFVEEAKEVVAAAPGRRV